MGGGELGDEEVQDDRELLPLGVCVGQDRGEETIRTKEGLRLAFEVHLAVLVELRVVHRHTGVARIGSSWSRVGAPEVAFDECLDLGGIVHLITHRERPSGRAACSGSVSSARIVVR